MSRSSPIIFYGIAIPSVLVKIWLVSGQSIFVNADSIYDDRLFLNVADSLLAGKWLGSYNQLTLVKGILYPIWISLVSFLNIPILLAQHILYGFMCFIFLMAVKPLIDNHYIKLVLFILLLFNPMSYSVWVMPVVQREAIYPALTILLFACLFGMILKGYRSVMALLVWSILLGISLSFFWLTREEGIWIIPSYIVIMVYLLFKIYTYKECMVLKSIILLFPCIILCCFIFAVGVVNWINYDVFVINELKSTQFEKAYGRLLSVQAGPISHIDPVPKNVRNALYSVSPLFSELEPYFLEEEKKFKKLSQSFSEQYKTNHDYALLIDYLINHLSDEDIWKKSITDGSFFNDINGGFFVWVFRDAVAAAGYYDSAEKAAMYYQSLAEEISFACEQGKISCVNQGYSLIPTLKLSYLALYNKTLATALIYLLKFDGFSTQIPLSVGSEESVIFAKKILKEKIFPVKLKINGKVLLKTDDKLNFDVVHKNGTIINDSISINQNKSADVIEIMFTIETHCINDCDLKLSDTKGTMYLYPLNNLLNQEYDSKFPVYIDRYEYLNGSAIDVFKLHTLDIIGSIYKKLFLFLAPIGFLFFFYFVVYQKLIQRNEIGFSDMVLMTLLVGILSRLCILSLVHITFFPAIITRYIAPVYPLYIIFACLSCWLPIKNSAKNSHEVNL